MTIEVAGILTEDAARRLTERIRYTALGVRDGVEKLQRLVAEAQEGRAHVALGYKSWTAYLADVMGDEPLVLARDQRRDVVAWLAGEGMSTRAIAPIVGASFKTVARDIDSAPVSSDTPDTAADLSEPEFAARVANATEEQFEAALTAAREDDDLSRANVARRIPDEVEPADDEFQQQYADAITEKPPVVITGMDGKTYTRPNRPPAPRRERTDVVVEMNKTLDAAEEAALHAERITAAHLTNRSEEATVWTRRLSTALESLERLNTSLQEASL